MLIESNVNLKKIQTLMGHSSIETTLNVYGHFPDVDKENGKDLGMLSQMLFKDDPVQTSEV